MLIHGLIGFILIRRQLRDTNPYAMLLTEILRDGMKKSTT